jgi:hypothetical protein
MKKTILSVVMAAIVLTGCDSKEQKKLNKQYISTAKSNAVKYIEDKYGFTPEVRSAEQEREYGWINSTPLSTVYVRMNHDGRDFGVYIEGATDNTDGLHFVTRNYEMDFVISDIYEDLNDFKDGAASKFVILDQYGNDKDISKFTNYYDMAHHGVNEFSYEDEEISPAVYPSSGDWLIDGTDESDEYIVQIPGYGGGTIDIYDKGGEDAIYFDSPFLSNNNHVFFNVEIQRNTDFSLKRATFGDDLYFSGDMSRLFDTDTSDDSYACVHNYFDIEDAGSGYIETIKDTGSIGGPYEVDFDKLVELKNDVASWIATNTSYSSVADVISNGSLSQINELLEIYTTAQYTNI